MSTEKADVPEFEAGHWTIRRGSLRGQHGYSHAAFGRGPMEGIGVLWGPSKGDPAAGRRKVKVMIGSAVCWRKRSAGVFAFGVAEDVLASLDGDAVAALPNRELISVRRLDVCIDHWGYSWALADLDRFACRQKGRGVAQEGELVEQRHGDRWCYVAPGGCTYYVGRRGSAARFLRIYDKTAEARATGKLTWLEPIWRQEGWDGEQTVWRAEIEHGGEWLRAHGLRDVLGLRGCERAMWEDYCADVRHTSGRNTRMENRKTSKVWQSLKAAAMRTSPGVWQWQPRPPTAGVDVDKLLAQAAGCINSAVLLLGEIPWELLGSTADDRRGEVLALVQQAADAAARRREEAAARAAARAGPTGFNR